MFRLFTRLVPAAVLLLAATACGAIQPAEPPDEEPTTVPSASKADPGAATLIEALDGDSMEAGVDGATLEVRMIGINAPEGDECHGDPARDALEARLVERPFDLVAGEGADRDRFGRALRYVESGGEDINAWMLRNGHGVALQGDHTRNAEYAALAEEAWQDRIGMWAQDACGPAATVSLEISRLEYNPPGPDGEVPEEEYVEITNRGDAAADLTGFTLRDESSTHRYRFTTVVLDPGASVRVRSGCTSETALDLSWCAGDAVWSNGGDTAILQDAAGNVVARRTYAGD